MEKLKEVTSYFDRLRNDDDETVYTEELIIRVLTKKLHLAQYEEVLDMPSAVVNDMIDEITSGRAPRLDNRQEQEILDIFEEILVCKKTEIPIIAKSLRYLLRDNKKCRAGFIIVDVQNDFISGTSALRNTPGEQEGEDVIPVINSILEDPHNEFTQVFYTLDWHPENHCSYLSNASRYELHESSPVSAEDAQLFDTVVYAEPKVLEQVLWPDHCLQGSEGAKLHPDLVVVEKGIMIHKGQIPGVDSYSSVWDNGKLSRSELLGLLFDMDITDVYVCGLATDFSVGYTALDIAEHGFDTFVVMDACRGVANESIEQMKARMEKKGCVLIESAEIASKIEHCKLYNKCE